MKKIIALLLIAASVFALASCSQSQKQEYLNSLVEDNDFSGVVLMTENGRTVCEVAGGVEKTNSNEPITINTRFCIGSVSKQFAAAAILTLQQDGKLNVNDRLEKYFPDYKYGNKLTIQHLLDMRSGIKEFYDVEYIDDAFTELPTGELRGVVTNNNSVEGNQKLLEDWLMKQPLDFEPDTNFDYSNSNYFLLARIVEIVSGESYNDYVHETIFEPLGMNNSSFIDEDDFRSVSHLAAPTVHPQTVYVGVTMGLGDIITNARDMDRWLTSLRTNQILTEESVKLMTTDYTESDDQDYGYGIRMNDLGLFHTGYITTYQAIAYTDPEKGVNIFIVTNDDINPDINVIDICWGLLEKTEEETKA